MSMWVRVWDSSRRKEESGLGEEGDCDAGASRIRHKRCKDRCNHPHRHTRRQEERREKRRKTRERRQWKEESNGVGLHYSESSLFSASVPLSST